MSIPFTYGKVAEGQAFINRTEEMTRLQNNLLSQTNTILISPRRWGKSSLVKKATAKIDRHHKNFKTCHLDLYNVRSEVEFYQLYAEAVINRTNSKIQDSIQLVKSFFKNIIPKISIAPDAQSEISLSMDWQSIAKNPREILNLSEFLAKKKKINLAICIDEFQNISSFDDPIGFQKSLRSVWQHHQRVAYCLYGSKRHMMMELFSSSQMPFYKFGDLIFLQKISPNHWIKYIQTQFTKSKKSISEQQAMTIVSLVDGHSYYIQQLAQMVWLRTKSKCTHAIIQDSILSLQMGMSLLFQQLTDALSNKQINFLQAVIQQGHNLSAKTTLRKFNLGTSATVNKSKKALEEKEVIDLLGREITFNDPIYRLWLTNFYF